MKKRYIILIIAVVIISSLIPYIIFGVALLTTIPAKFDVDNTKVTIKKYDIDINIVDQYYDEESKCYVMQAIVERDKNNKKATSIDVSYDLKNKDGYSIGTTNLYIDDMDKNTKWKRNINYCEDFANEVDNYEVQNIYVN